MDNIALYQDEDWEKLIQWFGNVENIELYFGVEFSCGDGLFLSQLEEDQDLNTFAEYDGKVDTDLFYYNGRLIRGPHAFKFSYNEDYLDNGKPRFSNCRVTR